MTVESAFYQLLSAAVAPLKPYMTMAPDDAPMPLVVYRMSGPEDLAPTLGGQSSLQAYRVQVDAWAQSPGQAATIGDQIRTALRNAAGATGGVVIAAVEIDGGFDDAEPGDGAVPVKVFRRATDLTLYVEQ